VSRLISCIHFVHNLLNK